MQLADEYDELLDALHKLIQPVEPLLNPDELGAYRHRTVVYQRKLERAAEAAALAQRLLTNGLPETRNAQVYKRITSAVPKERSQVDD